MIPVTFGSRVLFLEQALRCVLTVRTVEAATLADDYVEQRCSLAWEFEISLV